MTSLRQLVFGDWKLKLLALVISLAIFIVVRNDKDTEGAITVKVQYVNQPGSMTLMNELIFSVKLLVRGPWTRVKKINKKWQKTLIVDLSKVRGGRYELDSTMFKLPRGVRVTSISPSHLPIRMESILTRTIPITLAKIKTGRFYSVADIKLTPDKVTITGPKSDVLSVLNIPLPSITITDQGTFDKKLRLPELPPRLMITPSITHVDVKVTVEKTKETKSFDKVPILIDGDATLYKLSPSYVRVYVQGTKKALYGFSPSALKPFVTIPANITSNSFSLPVTLKNTRKEFTIRTVPARIAVTRISTAPQENDRTKKRPKKQPKQPKKQ